MISTKVSPRERRRHIQNFLLIAPQLILFIFLIILPAFIGTPMLFTDQTRFGDPEVNYVGLKNFKTIFLDETISEAYWPALVKTVRFTLLNTFTAYLFGLSFALLMYEIGFRGGLFTLIYMPYMLSGLALGFMAIMLFSDATGTANQLLMELGIIDKSINIKSSAGVTIGLPILVGWQFAGWNMAIFLSGLLSIPTDTIEAAIVDGASYIQRLRYVYFPQMVPSLVIVGSFALMGSFQIFDILIPLGALMGNNAAEFLSIVIFRYGFSANKLSLALAISVETLLPLMIVVIFLNWLQRRLSYET